MQIYYYLLDNISDIMVIIIMIFFSITALMICNPDIIEHHAPLVDKYTYVICFVFNMLIFVASFLIFADTILDDLLVTHSYKVKHR